MDFAANFNPVTEYDGSCSTDNLLDYLLDERKLITGIFLISAHKSLRVYIILLLILSTLACCGHVVFWALELSNKLDVSASTLCKF